MTTNNSSNKLTRNPWYWTILLMILGFAITKLTQFIIGDRPPPLGLIIDRLHILTTPINQYFHSHPDTTKFVLITTSLWFDFCCFFLSLRALIGPSIRPYLSLFLFLLLRQSIQLLVSLPVPQDIIWYYPGFPSLLVDYHATGDLYFSAHTGIALLGALELSRLGKKWITVTGYLFFAYLVSMVIIFRAHYTIDVFTALLVVFFVTYLSNKWSPYIDRFLRSGSAKSKV